MKAQKSESNISTAFNHTYNYQQVDDVNLAYYEQGVGQPVLFLHGIPDDDYSIERHYQYIKGFIENLELENVVIVVTDIGSLYGLKYAIENQSNIKGVVMIEAMYMPSEEWYGSLKMMQKMMFGMMKNEKRAYKMIVDKNMMPSMMLKMSVARKYDDELKANYNLPFENNVEKRKIMMYGAGPYTVPAKGKTKKKGDFADEINQIALGLKKINTDVPFLIVHAEPGMIVRKQAVEYAKANFKQVDFFNVGKGKHYLSEDHPEAIGKQILKWISSTETR